MTNQFNTTAIQDVQKYKLAHDYDYQSQMLVRPDGSWVKHDDYLALCDEVNRLRTIIDNLHHVEQKHRDTTNEQFHRANRLRAENEKLRAALKPFADEAAYWSCHNYTCEDKPVEGFSGYQPVMTCGDLFNARAVLAACKAELGED